MAIENAKSGKLLYHLTKLSNLDSIIRNGLIPRKTLLDNQIFFGDIANPDIISKRTQLGLDIYNPFHFHPYSSFDVAVKNTYTDDDFIYLCIHRNYAKQNNFKVLKKHPLSIDECVLYDYDGGIEQIDWDTLSQKGRTDDYAKHVKMAECLTASIVPVMDFIQIAVRDSYVKERVEDIFNNCNMTIPPPHINIQKWF